MFLFLFLVTITGRKELGNWNRDIINMTFLNPEEMKRLYAEMKESMATKKTNGVNIFLRLCDRQTF